jgi:hypothetical protein
MAQRPAQTAAVAPLLTEIMPLDRAVRAFDLAAERTGGR